MDLEHVKTSRNSQSRRDTKRSKSEVGICSCSLTELWSLLQPDINDQLALGGAESESGKVAPKWGAGELNM